MADQVDVSGGAPGPASGTAGGEGASQFGLTAAMALIVGSIIGVGDGLFPARFKRISKNGVPAFGIVASTVLASIAMIINYLGSNGPDRVRHHPGADDRHHRRHPVRLLRAGADQMAAGRPPGDADPAIRPGT